MHSAGIIRPGISPWRAQVLVVNNKESGKKTFCRLFTNGQFVYQLDAYLSPRIDDLLNELSAYTVLYTFDLKSVYHQIPILGSDKQHTALEAGRKLWEFNRIPFGVPQFQRKMDEIVELDKLIHIFSYLNYVMSRGMNQEKHDANVSVFVDALKCHLNLNDSKTVFSVSDISILR